MRGIRERAPNFVVKFARLKVDCIVATGVPSVRAAKEAANTIPIVIATIDADPVALGFIASLARPGGNITGLTAIDYERAGKRMELLKELAPKATRALVLHSSIRTGEAQRAHLRGIEAAGNKLGLRLQVMGIAGPDELESKAFFAARDGRAELLNVIAIGWINSHRERFVRFAADLRLPCVYSNPEFMRVGGLMSYCADRLHQNREVAGYVARILSGTKPADLLVQQPTKFQLAINLKTAKALGLTIPQSLLIMAGKVIK